MSYGPLDSIQDILSSRRVLVFWSEAVVWYDSNETSLSEEGSETCVDEVIGWRFRAITSRETASVDEE